MKLKGLMLGVAAAATATTAQAADLPVAPEPVDYVRVCDAYGSRFYYIPGTETCLRVGGRLRAQFVVNNV
ncbi:MAG: porin, partial [Rhodobacteraceae bacterium]|nr:porin [Paracoccaceae bacterium]